jgi:hypothetical protein
MGLQGMLTVNNLHDVPMHVHVNNQHVGFVGPFQSSFFQINHPPGIISVFEVYFPDGALRARYVLPDNLPVFNWNIDPRIP